MQLYTELLAQGFDRSYYSVRRQLVLWRLAVPSSGAGPFPRAIPTVIERPSARRVSWLLLMDEADLRPQEQQFRERLQERCPELQAASKLARELRKLVREQREAGRDAWLAQARAPEAVKKRLSQEIGVR